MRNYLYSRYSFLYCSIPHLALSTACIFAILFGASCAYEAEYSVLSLMGCAASAHVSIVGRLCTVFVPFLGVLLAATFTKPLLLIPVCFCKLFFFSFCVTGTVSYFGSAGWLMVMLLFFSDSISMLLLIRTCFRNINGIIPAFGRELVQGSAVLAGIVILECVYVAPFLVSVITI